MVLFACRFTLLEMPPLMPDIKMLCRRIDAAIDYAYALIERPTLRHFAGLRMPLDADGVYFSLLPPATIC